jgi:hypothetical protein
VEMDPWVVAQVLDANLSSTGFQGQAVVHTTRVEVLLQQAVNHGCMLPAILSLFFGSCIFYIVSPLCCVVHITMLRKCPASERTE